MKHLLSFEEFVNENYKIQEANDADGFDPTKGNVTDPEKAPVKVSTSKSDSEVFSSDQNPDKIEGKISSISDMKPGKEYVLTVDGKKNTDMLYQGVTNGVHVFNGEDKAHDITFSDDDLSSLISKGGVVEVAE
jgi:hypothetical protein